VDPETLLAQLRGIPGIGEWTAQYVAMRALGEPDAFPAGDLALLRKLGLRHPQELEERAQAWRPWRAYAAVYLWSDAGVDARSKKVAAVEAGDPSFLARPRSRSRANDAPKDLQFAD
jgi:3-methyladenine DNA glycosylase/8-oxoguanine DNA glycosylase